MPTEDKARALYHNKSALIFLDHWLTKNLEEDFNRLGHMLGVFWTQEDLEALFESNEDKLRSRRQNQLSSSVFYPLSFIISPQFPDILKKSRGRKYGILAPQWAKDAATAGAMDDMYQWDPNQFLKFVGGVVDSVAPLSRKPKLPR